MRVKFKKMHPDASAPRKMTDGACGFDLTAVSTPLHCHGTIHLETGETDGGFHEVRTGLAVQIPRGYVGLLCARSSVSKSGWSPASGLGVIDSDYRGEVRFRFYDVNCDKEFPYDVGDRIGQLLILPCPEVEFEEVDELDETERGSGGFGSTGGNR